MGNERICEHGHRYTKSSDCPTCPTCERLKKPTSGWKMGLAAPAIRALQGAGISTLEDLSKWSKADIASLHGMGPKAIAYLERKLQEATLSFLSLKE